MPRCVSVVGIPVPELGREQVTPLLCGQEEIQRRRSNNPQETNEKADISSVSCGGDALRPRQFRAEHERTAFSEADLALLTEALSSMFEHDHSAARGQMSEMELPTTGRLYNYSIVYRSFPGVTVPFISAVVDLDGGCSVKGNLLDVPVDPQVIAFDMPVDVVFRDGGQASPAAKGYTSFFFVPRQEAV